MDVLGVPEKSSIPDEGGFLRYLPVPEFHRQFLWEDGNSGIKQEINAALQFCTMCKTSRVPFSLSFLAHFTYLPCDMRCF